MADDVILVTETGQSNLQAYTNTVSGKSVKAEATVQVDLSGVPVPRGTTGDPRFVNINNVAVKANNVGAVNADNAIEVKLTSIGTSGSVIGANVPVNIAAQTLATLTVATSPSPLPVIGNAAEGGAPAAGKMLAGLIAKDASGNQQFIPLTGINSGGFAYTNDVPVVIDTILTNQNGNVNVSQQGAVTGVPIGAALQPFAAHITSNATTNVTAATAYIGSIVITTDAAGTTSTITVQDKSATPKKLVNAAVTTAISTTPTVLALGKAPVLMTGGIDIVTAGVAAATVDIWVTYWQ